MKKFQLASLPATILVGFVAGFLLDLAMGAYSKEKLLAAGWKAK
jgi:hypothetical protein